MKTERYNRYNPNQTDTYIRELGHNTDSSYNYYCYNFSVFSIHFK